MATTLNEQFAQILQNLHDRGEKNLAQAIQDFMNDDNTGTLY